MVLERLSIEDRGGGEKLIDRAEVKGGNDGNDDNGGGGGGGCGCGANSTGREGGGDSDDKDEEGREDEIRSLEVEGVE